VWTYVSEKRITSIFRVENQPSKKPTCSGILPGHLPYDDFCSTDFWPWGWRWYIPPKPRFTLGLQDAISQRMATSLTTAVRASNSTLWNFRFFYDFLEEMVYVEIKWNWIENVHISLRIKTQRCTNALLFPPLLLLIELCNELMAISLVCCILSYIVQLMCVFNVRTHVGFFCLSSGKWLSLYQKNIKEF
jgi:hypothetical protein